jgi:hypothetical protein
MRKAIALIFLFLLLLAAPSAVRYFQYYQVGGGERVPPPVYDPAEIVAVPTPPSSTFVDEPERGEGLVLLDEAHGNEFALADIRFLDGRLAARGFELLHFTGGDLARQLRPVNAFISITPLNEFSAEEILAVSRFVDRGGRLLLVGDPTRYQIIFDEEDPFAFTFDLETDEIPLNTLANEFDIIYNGDYVYNTSENEGNFRNIILKSAGFSEDSLLDGLEQLAVYSTHSLQIGPDAEALITGDDNTWSSATDRPGELILAALNGNGRVLALGDVHFLNDPYYTVYDNSQFIANIADFLTESSERALVLADFPYFYQQPVDLIYTGSPDLGAGAFADIIDLQTAFQNVNIPLNLAQEARPGHDALYLGLYNQSEDVADILATAGISLTIEPPIPTDLDMAEETEIETETETETGTEAETGAETETETGTETETETEQVDDIRLIHSELGNVEMSGTALVVLAEENGRRSVVVLAASREGLENITAGLLQLIPLDAAAALGGCLVQDPIALCPTLVNEEPVEAELITSGLPGEADANAGGGTGDNGDNGGGAGAELGAVDQGVISLGETVSDIELPAGESHAWTFNEGPAFIDITLESGDELDGVLELYDPDNNLISSVDSSYSGEEESLLGAEIPDAGDYTIIVRDFYEDGGVYTLTVTEGEEHGGETAVNQSIFLFVDDNGTPIDGGVNSADLLLSLLQPAYDITTWISSLDGPLADETLDGYGLVIWDSGDYQSADGFFDEDAGVILTYLDNGGLLFATGSAPTLFGELPLSPLADVKVTGDDPILLNGLNSGDVIPLDQTYSTIISDLIGDANDPTTTPFLLRGPESEGEDSLVAFAVNDEQYSQQTAFIMFPLVALPEETQPIIVENVMAWFGFSGS